MRMRRLGAMSAVLLASGCGEVANKPAADGAVANASAASISDAVGPAQNASEATKLPPEREEAASYLSAPQSNAVRSAEQYLAMAGFSREGLIEQLSSDAGDGYFISDATAAVDSLTVDWNENAARSAKQYLDMSGFSCSGLIEQLSSDAGDKYTVAQAKYGARQAGAC